MTAWLQLLGLLAGEGVLLYTLALYLDLIPDQDDACRAGIESHAIGAGDRTARRVSTPRVARSGLRIVDGSGAPALSRSIRRRRLVDRRLEAAVAGDVVSHPETRRNDLTPIRAQFQERAAPRATWRRQRRRDPP